MQDMAFSYHENHPSLMNLAYLPSEMPLLPQQIGDMAFFLQNYSSGDNSQLQEDSSTSPDLHCFMPPLVAEPIQDKKAPNQQHSGEKKRKINKDEKSKGVKTSKQKKASSGLSEAAYRKEELSAEYIRVRARRGEATDSHSLAERIRREKISERMKVLQSLVPGCEKVTGKALMLDEIINYVQSLQNQVEFLSMRLASLNPVLYFGADLDDERVMRTQVPSIAQSSHLQPVAFSDGTANCPMIGQWAHCFPHGQGAISLPQDYLMQLDSQRQGLLSQTGDIKACSFQ